MFGLVLSLLFTSLAAAAGDLPSYERGELIPLFYNKVFSHRTQFPYAYSSLQFICPPYTEVSWKDKPRMSSSWLVADQDWQGNRLVESDYKIATLDNVDCNVLCTRVWSPEDAQEARELIENDYQVEWYLDGLPGATASYTNEVNTRAYRAGFPLGLIKNDKVFIHNHVTFNILYTPVDDANNRIHIVGFEVYPDSVANGQCTHTSIDYTMQEVMTDQQKSITFTYSVRWNQIKSPTRERWDMYIIDPDIHTHFYAMINSVITVLILVGTLGVILLKTLRKDGGSSSHEDMDYKLHDSNFEDIIGWRLIHRDVFRRPIYGGLLAPIVGSGVQLLTVIFAILGCFVAGWCHPADSGSVISVGIAAFTLGSVLAGYYSARIYKVFRGKSWFLDAALTCLIVPGFIYGCLMVTSSLGWVMSSSIAISAKGWVMLTGLWLLVIVPLTFLGALVGDRRDRIEHPVRTTQMPRYIPEKRWYQEYGFSIAIGGVIPFAVIFVDLDELLKTITQGELYLSAQYIVTAWLLLAIATASVTIVLVFLQLCNEDYHWWWMSFALGASSSIYMFLYSLIFYWIRSDITGLASGAIFVMHTLLGCVLVGVANGALGFLSAYSVIRRIYSGIKVD